MWIVENNVDRDMNYTDLAEEACDRVILQVLKLHEEVCDENEEVRKACRVLIEYFSVPEKEVAGVDKKPIYRSRAEKRRYVKNGGIKND